MNSLYADGDGHSSIVSQNLIASRLPPASRIRWRAKLTHDAVRWPYPDVGGFGRMTRYSDPARVRWLVDEPVALEATGDETKAKS